MNSETTGLGVPGVDLARREFALMGTCRPAGWHFALYEGVYRWVALAKRTPFENGHPIYEPGELQFEFGATRADALVKLVQSLPAFH